MKANTSTAPEGGSIQNALEHGIDTATRAAHDSIDSVSEAATHAAVTLGGKGDQLNASGRNMANRAENYINEHPMASLGLAVAAGFFLSRLLSSR
jgi:ElaB/YqjD/DUF883 family membrane-anchored ribosome-binding protein